MIGKQMTNRTQHPFRDFKMHEYNINIALINIYEQNSMHFLIT